MTYSKPLHLQLDGVDVYLHVDPFPVGASMFIASPNPTGWAKTITKVLTARNIATKHYVGIENGLLGFRIWRIS